MNNAGAPSPAGAGLAASSRPAASSRAARLLTRVLLSLVAVLLTVVILTPIALSSHDLIAWAAAPTGLALRGPWPALVFLALDAAAGVCVLLAVYSAWRGQPAGVFGVLIWCFAAGSAFANWRHATAPQAAPDAGWFFPAMSLAGPALLEAVLGRLRRWIQTGSGRRSRPVPAFGWRRWTPGLGATRDTYGAYRTALLLGLDTVEAAITAYHTLCPDGSLHVAAALRARHAAGHPQQGRDSDQNGTQPTGIPVLPVDLMRRIPVDPGAYQRWRAVWADLQHDSADPASTADHHQLSVRQIQFIRRAGQAGLLDSPIPPAVRLAELASPPDTQPETTTAPAPDHR